MPDVLINGWFWARSETGSGQYLTALLQQFARQAPDYRFHLLVPAHTAHVCSDGDNVTVHAVALPPGPVQLAKVWWEQWTVPRWSRKVNAALLWNPYWTASLWQPVPVLVTVHDIIPAVLPEYRRHFRQRLYLRLTRFTTRRARHLLTVSQAAKQDMMAHLALTDDRISVVHNGVAQPPSTATSDVEPEVAQALSLPHRYFLYLGGYERRKNVETTLRAFRRFRELGGDPAIKLVLAGTLPAADTAVLQHPGPIIEALGLQGDVLLLGHVSEQQKALLYRQALAFVFPGLYEGFGLMIVEAMQAGVPVITSHR